MKELVRKCAILPTMLALCVLSPGAAEAANEGHETTPKSNAYIAKYYVSKAAAGSNYDTGPLHIVYSDGTDVVQNFPPRKKSTANEIVYDQEGFSDVQLAEDRQTLGWTETYENAGTSYAIPLVVVLYRSGKVLQRLQTGQMVWNWMFFDGGKRAGVVWGPTHGPEVGDFVLYNASTGKALAEVYGDPDTQALKADAPGWAKELEGRVNGDDSGK